MGVNIELSYAEILLAAQAGLYRHVECIKSNRKPYYGAGDTNPWQLNIEGCLGERALAKYLNLYWNGLQKLRDYDVGGAVDVRTRSKHNYDLILHPDDPDDRKFYLLTGQNGKYIIHGWIMGVDGKKEKFWKDPAGGRPAFFVPKKYLNKI